MSRRRRKHGAPPPELARAGVLVVDKPRGHTSAAVVAHVRTRLRGIKAGHTGTLDPLATGVLPICLGDACKLAGLFIAEDKSYLAELELGVATDSYDAEGEVVATDDVAAGRLDPATVAAALAGFVGVQVQRPPRFSAVKVGGRRLHVLARAGEDVEAPERTVTIHRAELVEWLGPGPAGRPRLRIAVDGSKGTFVRTLVHDLGQRLGCGAHLTELRRTRSGPFELAMAVELGGLTPGRAAAALVPMAKAVGLPSWTVDEAMVPRIARGEPLYLGSLSRVPAATRFQVVDEQGDLLAVVERGIDRLAYVRVLITQDQAAARAAASAAEPLVNPTEPVVDPVDEASALARAGAAEA